MSETSTETALAEPSEDSLSQSASLGFSIGSLSSPRRASAQISKTYKDASSLFLTRRLPEALSTIEPLINIPSIDDGPADDESPVAPIVNASRSLRIKVWSLYLTLLNSIIELGPEDGKATFGGQVWRSIRDKARDGSIWNEVVQVGYGGIEENVDADVVINLATLLLSQSPSQATNQQRLESYLAGPNEPILDLSDHIEQDSPSSHTSKGIHHEASTNTPRELASRIQILELYALHILPRNEEWEYAREFINMSEVLDEERREAFLQTLQSLQDETKNHHNTRPTLHQEKNQTPNPSQPKPNQKTNPSPPQTPPPKNHNPHPPKPPIEKDYGIDHRPSPPSNPLPLSKNPLPPKPHPQNPNPPATLYTHTLHLLTALHHLLSSTASSLSRNPLAALRLVVFIAALVMAVRRRGVQERVGRAWEKVRRTVGMGVKVGYV